MPKSKNTMESRMYEKNVSTLGKIKCSQKSVYSENGRRKYKITRDIEHAGKKKIETPTNRYTHIQCDSVWKRLLLMLNTT